MDHKKEITCIIFEGACPIYINVHLKYFEMYKRKYRMYGLYPNIVAICENYEVCVSVQAYFVTEGKWLDHCLL
jgi:hypothetical protein